MSAGSEQRKLAAIMFTDMVGYSALSQRDDKLALELLEEHRQLLREIFPRFNGTEIKTIGDAFLIEFNSALEAAQCAIEIQRTLAKRNHDVTADRRIELKIGIHIGDVVHRGGDVYGDGVNIASRIEQLAGTGGICVSMDVERQIRNALEARFEKLAATELKNISVPMDLFRIVLPWEKQPALATRLRITSEARSSKWMWIAAAVSLLLIIGIGWWWTTLPHKNLASPAAEVSRPQNIPEKSIAVLPFANLSGDPENAYFADGIQEEILTRLSKIRDLKVISRTSTHRFKSTPDDLPEIARQLGVAHILEGTVQKAADQVRVNVQLIRAENDSHLWSEKYDRKLTDIFAVESEIATKIATALQATLSGAEQKAIATRPTENSEAHQLYLKGRYFWNKRYEEPLKKAADYFKQALDVDPNYAPACVGLAESYLLLGFQGYGVLPPTEAFPKAKAAAEKALQIDDTLGEAHASLANVRAEYDWDLAGADREFKRAIELAPGYATAHQWYGIHLAVTERFPEAMAELARAQELDPLSMIINVNRAWVFYFARQYDKVIEECLKSLELDRTYPGIHWMLGQAYRQKGMHTEAIAEFQEVVRISGGDKVPIAVLGHGYAVAGERKEAQKIIDELTELKKQRYFPSYFIALIYVGLGDNDEAFAWLEKAFIERSDLTYLKVEPMFDPLRSDPRFQNLLQRIGVK